MGNMVFSNGLVKKVPGLPGTNYHGSGLFQVCAIAPAGRVGVFEFDDDEHGRTASFSCRFG